MNNTKPVQLDFRPILIALQFLTVLPVPLRGGIDGPQLGRAVIFFPAAGLVVGLLVGGSVLLLGAYIPAAVLAALVLLFGAILTGGLHLDGLADTCDGLFVFRSADRRLEIMRDSRIGSYGVIGLICVLLGKYAALSTLLALQPVAAIQALVLAALLSRWAIAFCLVRYPYARAAGSGSGFKEHATLNDLRLATIIAVLAVLPVGGLWGLAAFGVAVLAALGIARWILGMLPGMTGDTYGAVSELTETAVLIAFCGFAH